MSLTDRNPILWSYFPVLFTADKRQDYIVYTTTLTIEPQYLSENELTDDGHNLIAIISDPIQNIEPSEVFMVHVDYIDYQTLITTKAPASANK